MSRDLLRHLGASALAELDELGISEPVAAPVVEAPTGSLLDFVPRISPEFQSPVHLAPLARELERARHEPVRLLVSSPPRHGKTELLLHFVALVLKDDPSKQFAYVTHTDRLAKKKSAKARSLAIRAGVRISSDSSAKHDWRTGVRDGGLWATSRDGGLTGEGFHFLLIDDLVKDRAAAESAVEREADHAWFKGTAFNRVEPTGSIIVNHTRWHDDDLIGRLAKEGGWTVVNLPAILDDGTPLWPGRWTLERLGEIRAQSEYDWLSLYMGTPRSRSGRLFEGVKTYTEAPKELRIAIGVDLAYTAKTSSDWSVAVVLGEANDRWYVLRVVRRQVRADEFAGELLKLKRLYPTAVFRLYGSTTEIGSADLLKLLGVPISGVIATHDKYVRAQPVAVAWKAGKVLLPAQPPPGMTPEELGEFIRVVNGFTGVGDLEDDDVDALAPAYDLLPGKIVVRSPAIGSPEWMAAETERMREAARTTAERDRMARQNPAAFNVRDPFLGGRR